VLAFRGVPSRAVDHFPDTRKMVFSTVPSPSRWQETDQCQTQFPQSFVFQLLHSLARNAHDFSDFVHRHDGGPESISLAVRRGLDYVVMTHTDESVGKIEIRTSFFFPSISSMLSLKGLNA